MKNACRTCVLVIVTVLGTSLAISTAWAQAPKQGPTKYDEFGYLNHENYSAHLDGIAVALQAEPTFQGYFLFYNGQKSLPGAALRYMKRLQNYMTNTRGIEPARMILLAGGRREEMTVEFWISPPGNRAPIPNPAVSVEPSKPKSYLYDSYEYGCHPLFRPKVARNDIDDCAYGGSSYEDQSARLDGFIKAVSQTPGATARLVVYSLPRDASRKVQKFIQQEKDYLVSKGGINASRIALVFRRAPKYRSVELWVVLPGLRGIK